MEKSRLAAASVKRLHRGGRRNQATRQTFSMFVPPG